MKESEMRALDVWLATHVMGWERYCGGWCWAGTADWMAEKNLGPMYFPVGWHPTEDWACAGLLLDKMAADGWEWDAMNLTGAEPDKKFWSNIGRPNESGQWIYGSAEAPTPQLAICLAARKAKEAADDQS